MICALGCACVFSGCAVVSVGRPPPCPAPSEAAIEQTRALEGTALERYLGEIERYCDAIERL